MSYLAADTGNKTAFEGVAEFIGARTGLAFPPNRFDDIEAGVRRAMTRTRIPNADQFLSLLITGAIPLDDLIAELTVGETYFFREPAQFQYLRERILPELVHTRGQGHTIRAWSAGCATGEEPYSLAIMLGEEGLADRAKILGTDISLGALERARRALYGAWSMRGVIDRLLDQNFTRAGERWELQERHRKRVEFKFLNLACMPYSITAGCEMDIILCRNVLIYLGRETIERVARGLYASLADGGWLLTGPSDPPLGNYAPFQTVETSTGVFYRRGAHANTMPNPLDEPPKLFPRYESLPETRANVSPETSAQQPEPAREPADNAETAVLRLRTLANQEGAVAAATAATAEIRRYPCSPELHFLSAMILSDLGRDDEAVKAIKRTLYLDRSIAVAHFLLGTLYRRRGDLNNARRAYRNAGDLAKDNPTGKPLAFFDDEPATGLLKAVTAELALLDGEIKGTS